MNSGSEDLRNSPSLASSKQWCHFHHEAKTKPVFLNGFSFLTWANIPVRPALPLRWWKLSNWTINSLCFLQNEIQGMLRGCCWFQFKHLFYFFNDFFFAFVVNSSQVRSDTEHNIFNLVSRISTRNHAPWRHGRPSAVLAPYLKLLVALTVGRRDKLLMSPCVHA